MLRLRHLGRITAQMVGYSAAHREWWMLVVLVLFALAVLLVTAGHAAAPYTLYTLF